MSEYKPIYQQLINVIQDFCIFISLILFLAVFKKKKQIKDALLNTSYSQISTWILNLVSINMIIFAALTFIRKLSTGCTA